MAEATDKTNPPTNIPVLDLNPEIDALWDELNAAIQGVLRSTQFIMGPNVKALEGEMAAYLGARHALGVNSGTDALVIALRALGVGPGDEVITTPFTFFATAEAISQLGATPVFADIDPRTFNLDPAAAEAKVTPRTRAIIPVHLFGQAADMDPITETAGRHGLKVLEDTAQGLGGKYKGRKLGTIGDAGAYSFFPSKNLGAFGDAGLISADDDEVAATCRMLRVHGSRKKYYNEVVGYNSRLDEIQAAVLRVKLPRLDRNNEGRRRAAAFYTRRLGEAPGVTPPYESPDAEHAYHQYTVRVHGGRRDAVQHSMSEAGVGTMVYYPVPVHRLPIYSDSGASLPNAEAAAEEVLSLPIWPDMDEAVQERVVEALREGIAGAG
jgi:dTDP-4-amino-4,6-dideoxygalactose transaminase